MICTLLTSRLCRSQRDAQHPLHRRDGPVACAAHQQTQRRRSRSFPPGQPTHANPLTPRTKRNRYGRQPSVSMTAPTASRTGYLARPRACSAMRFARAVIPDSQSRLQTAPVGLRSRETPAAPPGQSAPGRRSQRTGQVPGRRRWGLRPSQVGHHLEVVVHAHDRPAVFLHAGQWLLRAGVVGELAAGVVVTDQYALRP